MNPFSFLLMMSSLRTLMKDYTKFDVLKVWPDGQPRPSLAKFVTKDSWLMLSLLDLMEDPKDVEWLSQDVKLWRKRTVRKDKSSLKLIPTGIK